MSANAPEKSKAQGSNAANGQDGREAPKEAVSYDYSFQNQQQMGYAAPMNDYYGYNQMQQYSYFGDNWSNGATGDMFVSYGQGGQMQDYSAAGGQQGFAGYGYPVDQFSSWGNYSDSQYQYFGGPGQPGQAVGSARGGRGYEAAEYYSEEAAPPAVASQPPVTSAQEYQRPPSSHEYQRPSNGEMDPGLSQIEQGIKGVALGDKEAESSSSYGSSGGGKKSWASIASQPARALPPTIPSQKPRGRGPQPINTFESKPRGGRGGWGGRPGGRGAGPYNPGTSDPPPPPVERVERRPQREEPAYASDDKAHPVLEELKKDNEYNPGSFNVPMKNARYFVIKSYSEDDIHRAIKYNIWCSTEHGNKRLDSAFKERADKGPIYLFYSVNGSGHFCGVAKMLTSVDYNSEGPTVWAQDKWKGRFKIKWIYVKDVPNQRLRHIRLENNDNKPVTNSRDTQEVPADKGRQVLETVHEFKHSTSIFDDFSHYEKRQEEETHKKPSSARR